MQNAQALLTTGKFPLLLYTIARANELQNSTLIYLYNYMYEVTYNILLHGYVPTIVLIHMVNVNFYHVPSFQFSQHHTIA